jgi:hypothetical protein
MTAINRRPPAIAALDGHGKICRHCIEAAKAGLPKSFLCDRGRVLARLAKREQDGFRRAA